MHVHLLPHRAGSRLWLRFADGAFGELDLIDRLRGPVFGIARTEAGFALVSIDPEGHTVSWPGGADLAPDVLIDGTDVATARDVLTREMQARLDEIAAADAAA